MGGGDIIASFLDAQAIDEFIISVIPVFIGDGIPLIARRHRHVRIEAFYARCIANGAQIIKPLTATAWGTSDFYIEDPDGYIVCFGGRPTGS